MKRLLWENLATLSFLLLFCPAAEAAIVIDSFDLDSLGLQNGGGPGTQDSQTQPITIAGQPASRRLDVGGPASVNAQGIVLNGQYDFITLPAAGGSTNAGYSDFNLNASNHPFLRVDLVDISGVGNAVVEIKSTSAPNMLGAFTVLPTSIPGPTSLHFDIRNFPGYQPGFLTGLNEIKFGVLGVQGGVGSAFFIKVSKLAFATQDEYEAYVPEPSTLLLLLTVAAGLALINPRRRTPLSLGERTIYQVNK